jgi:hypothetical protein
LVIPTQISSRFNPKAIGMTNTPRVDEKASGPPGPEPKSMMLRLSPYRETMSLMAGPSDVCSKFTTKFRPINPIPIVIPEINAFEGFKRTHNPKTKIIMGIKTVEPRLINQWMASAIIIFSSSGNPK